jgi:signal transduction histidine kinase
MYLWSLALAVALPCAAVLAYSIFSDARHDERQVKATTLSLAQLVASQTQQFLADSENVLRRLATRPLIRALDPERRPATFDTFLDLHPQYANLVLCDATGRVVHSASPLPADKALSDIHAAWVGPVLRNGRFTVGKPILGQITERWVCELALPVRDTDGELAGALGMSVDLERFRAPASLVSLPPNSEIAIVDQDGTVIARSINPRGWVGRDGRAAPIVDFVLAHAEGSATTRGLEGEERIYGFTTIPRVGWHVLVGIPTRFTFAAARANALRAGLFGAVLLGLVIGLVLLLGSRINRPMRALFRAATAVAEGKLETTAPTTGPKEIASVAEAFNRMLAIRRQKEAEVETLNRELEQRVRERTIELETANAELYHEVLERKQAERTLADRTIELEVANQELEAFSYSVSHDLRAPLRGIEGYAGALEEDHGPKLDEQARTYIERIRLGVRRMSQLIEGLLNLSRVSRSELNRSAVNLSELAGEIAAESKEAAPARNVELNIHPGLTAWGDRHLLRVALGNLMGNAWKFTGKQSDARIEFGTAIVQPPEGSVPPPPGTLPSGGSAGSAGAPGENAFFIRDNGAGFDMAYVNKLFQVFQRLHAPSDYEGTGIGLATVQRIIRRHGGRIWCEGEIGKGATFYFTLPTG